MAQSTFSVDGRQVVVVGAARSGLAAAELLRKRGARVTLTESRPSFAESAALEAAGVRVETGGHQAATLAEADLVVVSPGVPLEQPVFEAARARGVEIIGELEMAWRWLKGKVIAVTGTKGKSTTTTLIGRMLSAAGRHVLVGGNIGVPISAQVEESTDRTLHVVEVSSFQLATTTTFRPWVAVWLNLSDDHLDRHASFQEYGDAKARIFANQVPSDFAVVNADDPAVAKYSGQSFATRVWFSPHRQAERRLRDRATAGSGARRRRHSSVSCRWPRCGCPGRTCSATSSPPRRPRTSPARAPGRWSRRCADSPASST